MNNTILEPAKNHILSLLGTIKPHDFLEEQHLKDTIDWVKSGKPIFRIHKPDIPNKHLVSYFLVFDEIKKEILLVDHKKAELWLPPGGHVDINEDPTETVRRECREELSVSADFWCKNPIFVTQTITVGKTAGHTDVSLWYVIKGSSQNHYEYDQEEFKSIKWFTLDEIPYNNTDPHMKRFITKLKGLI